MTSPDAAELVELRTTFASRAAAEACAERLVSARLAACVQVDGPVQSIYRWEGTTERTEEWRCSCKTAPHRADACRDAILESHDYRTPEILMARVTASAAYAAWARACVTMEDPAAEPGCSRRGTLQD